MFGYDLFSLWYLVVQKRLLLCLVMKLRVHWLVSSVHRWGTRFGVAERGGDLPVLCRALRYDDLKEHTCTCRLDRHYLIADGSSGAAMVVVYFSKVSDPVWETVQL